MWLEIIKFSSTKSGAKGKSQDKDYMPGIREKFKGSGNSSTLTEGI